MDEAKRQNTCIAVAGLSLEYRTGLFRRHRVHALRDISFEIATGTLTALVGANGSGKSSILRCLLDLETPSAGEARLLGHRCGSRELRGEVGAVLEGRLPLGRLTGREYLTLAASIGGQSRVSAQNRANTLLDALELDFAADRAHGQWSSGMERRLAFAEALVSNPEILVLDEPGSGLDPIALQVLRDALESHRAEGRSAIVATHALDAIGPDLFDRILVLVDGRLVADGTPDEVLGRERTRELRWSDLDDTTRDRLLRIAEDGGATLVHDGRAHYRLAEALQHLRVGGNSSPTSAREPASNADDSRSER